MVIMQTEEVKRILRYHGFYIPFAPEVSKHELYAYMMILIEMWYKEEQKK